MKKKCYFDWAMESLPIDLADKIYFICLKEHESKFSVRKFIKKSYEKNL